MPRSKRWARREIDTGKWKDRIISAKFLPSSSTNNMSSRSSSTSVPTDSRIHRRSSGPRPLLIGDSGGGAQVCEHVRRDKLLVVFST
jgi:hypothetical protein